MSIPYELNKYHCHLTQIVRSGRVVMYKLEDSETKELRGFEVMVVQNRKEAILNGRTLPAGEALPSSSQWGTFGWSYMNIQEKEALERFAKVCKQFNPQPRKPRKPRKVRRLKRVRRLVRK